MAVMSKRPDSAPLSVLCYTRSKADKDAANYATLLEKVKGSYEGKRPALLLKEAPAGEAAEAWRALLKGACEAQLDLGPMAAELLLAKDATEVPLLRKAGIFSAALLSEYLLPAIEAIVDEKKPTRTRRGLVPARPSRLRSGRPAWLPRPAWNPTSMEPNTPD